MATMLDFTKFNFSTEEIRAVNELVFDAVLQAPEITMITTLYPGIVFNKQIGFIGEGAPVGKARQKCKPTPQQWKIGTRAVTWEPKPWEILIEDCWAELEDTAATYALNTGIARADFTNTDYFDIVVSVLTVAIKKFIIRLVWFSDVDAEYVSDGGIISNDSDVELLTIIDGLWKQLIAQAVANPDRRVVIAENAGTTYATQKLSPNNVISYLEDLRYNAPILLRGQQSAFIACTQSFYDAYSKALKGFKLESTYTNLVNGQATLTYDSVPLIPLPIMDEMILTFENTGTKLNSPHRALYVIKDILGVAVDGENSFEQMDIWYERKDRTVNFDAIGMADAKLLHPDMFQLAI